MRTIGRTDTGERVVAFTDNEFAALQALVLAIGNDDQILDCRFFEVEPIKVVLVSVSTV